MCLMIGIITNIVTDRILEGEDHGLQEEIIDQEADIEDLDPDLEVVDIKIFILFLFYFIIIFIFYFIIIFIFYFIIIFIF
jgi:hypothetical protein